MPPRAASKMRSLHFWTLQVGWQVWSGQHLWDPVAGALPDLLHRLRRLAHRRASHHAGNVDRRVQAHLGRRDRRRHLPHGIATAGPHVRPGLASAAAPPAPRPAWWLELCRALRCAPARGCGRPPFLGHPPQAGLLGPHPAPAPCPCPLPLHPAPAPCTLHPAHDPLVCGAPLESHRAIAPPSQLQACAPLEMVSTVMMCKGGDSTMMERQLAQKCPRSRPPLRPPTPEAHPLAHGYPPGPGREPLPRGCQGEACGGALVRRHIRRRRRPPLATTGGVRQGVEGGRVEGPVQGQRR